MTDKPNEPGKPETASQRFLVLTTNLMRVPKAEIDAKEAELKRKKARKKKKR
jgi:hypothetical protein